MLNLTTSLLLSCLAFNGMACATLASTTNTENPQKEDGISLTVYSSADPAGFDPQRFISQQRAGNNPGAAWSVPGFGLVRETRTVSLDKGQGELRFTDVAAFIDPTTVGFRDLDGKGTKVFEQNCRIAW